MMSSLQVVIVFFLLFVYFTPTIGAALRHHPRTLPIFLLNVLFSWTFIGWFAALGWPAFMPIGL